MEELNEIGLLADTNYIHSCISVSMVMYKCINGRWIKIGRYIFQTQYFFILFIYKNHYLHLNRRQTGNKLRR